jgi:hypothetical protein
MPEIRGKISQMTGAGVQELQNGTTDFQCINARTSLIPFYELRWPPSRTPELLQPLNSFPTNLVTPLTTGFRDAKVLPKTRPETGSHPAYEADPHPQSPTNARVRPDQGAVATVQ